MWKLTFHYGAKKYEYVVDSFQSPPAAHFFSGTTKEGNRIIWSGEYLLEKIPEEPLTK